MFGFGVLWVWCVGLGCGLFVWWVGCFVVFCFGLGFCGFVCLFCVLWVVAFVLIVDLCLVVRFLGWLFGCGFEVECFVVLVGLLCLDGSCTFLWFDLVITRLFDCLDCFVGVVVGLD